ncbi:MAG: fatty acid desaturase [Myxococcota bacterium]
MPDARPSTLSSVLESIPPRCYENPTWRGVCWLLRDLTLYALGLAALWRIDHPGLLVPLWGFSALTIAALFIVGHDAAHGALFRSRRLCYALGQLAMLPSLHLYEAWVFGHNRIHHGHTAREGMDYVWHPLTPSEYRALSPLGRLAHRVKWSWLGAGLYYIHEIWWQRMIRFRPNPKLRRLVHRDRIVVGSFAVVASGLLLWGGGSHYGTAAGALWMWLKLGIVPFLLFGQIIGWAVYVHHISPELRWHSRRDWDKFKGQVEGTTVLHAPRWLDFFLHGILLHVPHHVDMRIPFYHLPEAERALQQRWGEHIVERRLRLRDYLRATRECKLFDFERGTWMGYPCPPLQTTRALPQG